MQKDEKLTSIKITQPLYDNFKVMCIEDSFSLKKLVDRAIFLYLTDKEFRTQLRSQNNIKIK